MKHNFYIFKDTANELTPYYLAKQTGSYKGDPYYLTCVPDFAYKLTTLMQAFELRVELNHNTSSVGKRDFTVVLYEMDVEQMSFAKPEIKQYQNLLSESDALKIIQLDESLLPEKEREIFIEKYGI